MVASSWHGKLWWLSGRRVLLVHVPVEVGLTTCVWGRSQTFHSRERRHRGFVLMASEMEMRVDEHVTQTPFPP